MNLRPALKNTMFNPFFEKSNFSGFTRDNVEKL